LYVKDGNAFCIRLKKSSSEQSEKEELKKSSSEESEKEEQETIEYYYKDSNDKEEVS